MPADDECAGLHHLAAVIRLGDGARRLCRLDLIEQTRQLGYSVRAVEARDRRCEQDRVGADGARHPGGAFGKEGDARDGEALSGRHDLAAHARSPCVAEQRARFPPVLDSEKRREVRDHAAPVAAEAEEVRHDGAERHGFGEQEVEHGDRSRVVYRETPV